MQILLVDDNRTNLLFLSKLVSRIDGCTPVTFDDPAAVLATMPKLDFDLAIVDYQMPGYSGVELLKEVNLFEKYRGKPYVMVTADTDLATRMTCLDAGSIDFLTKPVNPLEFQARIKNLIALVKARNKLADKAAWLRREVGKAATEIRAREEEIIERLFVAASYKDSETGLHTKRVAAYSEAIAQAVGISSEECSDIKLASSMHDIGKVGIRDAVLLKKGKLTEQEFTEIQHHTTIGCDILDKSQSSLLRLAAEIAGSHHERWDGQGYPRRLSGEAIPLAGRIVAVADNFDALTTARPYKDAWSVEQAVEHIRVRAGTQFDPSCVAAFINALPVIRLIKATLVDRPSELSVVQ